DLPSPPESTELMIVRIALLAFVLAAVTADSAGAAHPTLHQPFDVLPLANGHLIVTDMPGNAVYDLDPARKSGRLVARIGQPRELDRLKDGRLLVTSGNHVLA